MRTGRKHYKYYALWNELDALAPYETWFIPEERYGIQAATKFSVLLNHVMGRGRYRAITAPGGILFVRIT